MTLLSIEDRVVEEIGRHLGADRLPSLSDEFVKDLSCDSLDSIEVLMALEDEFGIEIDDADAEECITVAHAVALVKKTLEKAS